MIMGKTPPSNDSLKASLSPPVGSRLRSFRRDRQTNKCSSIMLNIHHQSKFARVPLILSRPKAHQRSSSGLLSSLFVKERNRKGGKCRISLCFTIACSYPQASPRVEANDRHKQAHPLSTYRKVQKETPESIRASLIPGEWVSSTCTFRRVLSHSHFVACLNGKIVPEGCLHMSLLPWAESFSAHLEWWQVPQT